MITVCVNGALGRMGSTVCQAVDDDAELELTNSIDINSNQDKTINGQNIYKDISTMLKNSDPDLIVDFTNRESFLTLVRSAVPKGIKIVSGSTGLHNEDYEEIEKLCDKYKCGVLSASNFAVGAILLMHLSSIAGQYFDFVDLIESHHENKIDAFVYRFKSMLRIVFTKQKVKNRLQRDFLELKNSIRLIDGHLYIHHIQ